MEVSELKITLQAVNLLCPGVQDSPAVVAKSRKKPVE
jgi:hypothetical protein